MIPIKFRFIWPRFQRRSFKKSANQKQELPVAAIFINGSGQNVQSLERTSHRCFLPSFGSFGKKVSEEKNLINQPIRNRESPVAVMFVKGSLRNEPSFQGTFHRCFLPRFGSFGHAVSEENIIKNQPFRNKNCLWRPYLLMDRTVHRCFLPSFSSFP
jgi:hypothetical protein